MQSFREQPAMARAALLRRGQRRASRRSPFASPKRTALETAQGQRDVMQMLSRGQQLAESHSLPFDLAGVIPQGEFAGPDTDLPRWSDMGEGTGNLAKLKEWAEKTHSDKMALQHILKFRDIGSCETWELLAEVPAAGWPELAGQWRALAEVAADSAEAEDRPFRRLAWLLVEEHFHQLRSNTLMAGGTLPSDSE